MLMVVNQLADFRLFATNKKIILIYQEIKGESGIVDG